MSADPGESATDALGEALASPTFQAGIEREFWRLRQRKGDRAYIECCAWDDEVYLLELACDRYGLEPSLGRFVDPQTLGCVSSAWPQGDATFSGWFKWEPQNLFICWPGDRAGITHHPEWRAREHWKKTDNPLVQYLEFVRTCLNVRSRGYRPRPSPPPGS